MLWWCEVKIVKVMDEWREVPQIPISLYHHMSIDHLQGLLQRMLQTLVKPVYHIAAVMHCNSTSPIGRWHSRLTITPHVTPSLVNANHSAMLE